MSNLKQLVARLKDESGSYREAGKASGCNYSKLFRIMKDSQLLEANIEVLENIRAALGISKGQFWKRLTDGNSEALKRD